VRQERPGEAWAVSVTLGGAPIRRSQTDPLLTRVDLVGGGIREPPRCLGDVGEVDEGPI